MADAILASGGIYAIRNVVNGKQYIGSAVNIDRRWRRHRTDLINGRHHSVKLQRAWRKYGAEAFSFVALEYVRSAEDLTMREQHWIDVADAYGSGYNTSPSAGSCLGIKHSDEVKKAVSERTRKQWADPEKRERIIANRKGRTRSDATKAKISAGLIGKTRGRKQSPETIARRVATIRDRVEKGLITMARVLTDVNKQKMLTAAMTEEIRRKRAASLTGKKQPAEVIAKRVASIAKTRANKPPRVISDETRARMSAAQKGVPKPREAVERRVATAKLNRLKNLAGGDLGCLASTSSCATPTSAIRSTCSTTATASSAGLSRH